MHFSYQFGHFRRRFYKGFRYFGRLTLKTESLFRHSCGFNVFEYCMQRSARPGARALGDDRRSGAVRGFVFASAGRLPPPRRLSAATSPLGHPRGTLISTFSSGGGRLLPLPAARLRRHTLTAIRAGRRFPRPSCCLGAPSSPPPAVAFAVAGIRPPFAPHVRSVTPVRPSARGAGLRGRPAPRRRGTQSSHHRHLRRSKTPPRAGWQERVTYYVMLCDCSYLQHAA